MRWNIYYLFIWDEHLLMAVIFLAFLEWGLHQVREALGVSDSLSELLSVKFYTSSIPTCVYFTSLYTLANACTMQRQNKNIRKQ